MTTLDNPQALLLCRALDRLDILSHTIDQLLAVQERQDTALTELESRLLDIEQSVHLALDLLTTRRGPTL